MQILVNGANGFIGHNLCEYLVKQGHQVRRAVRVADDIPDTVVLDGSASVESIVQAMAGVDCVIHLAATVHMSGKNKDVLGEAYQQTNVAFTQRLAIGANVAGVRRFVFVSSIKVFGETSCGRPLVETDPVRPGDCYARSKWAAEQELRALEEKTGLEVVIVRPPLVYGPEVRANFLALLLAVKVGLPFPFSSLRNRRSLLYNDNLASALAACATHSQAAGETFNVADTGSVTLSDLVTELSLAIGRQPRIFSLPRWLLRVAVVVSWKGQKLERLINELEVDSSKIRNMLGWSPTYSFRQGIKATVDWYMHGAHRRRNTATKGRASGTGALKVCQLCAVDFTLQHLLLPLIDGMRERGWSLISVCSEGKYFRSMRQRGYHLKEVSISRNLFSLRSHLRAIWEIYTICRRERFDVLHVHTPIAALLGRIAGRMAGVPLIIYTAHGFYFHDEMPRWKYRVFVWLERCSGRLTDFLFTQSSEDARTAIAERIALPTKVTAIGNGVSVDSFAPNQAKRAQVRRALKIPGEAFLIGVVARRVREKGLLEFLEAAVELGGRFPHTYFLLIGERLPSDHDASIERELSAAQKILGPRLLAVGYRADVPDLLGAMDLFCLPSYREGMPRSIIEAMMMELPVVTTNIRGAREEVIPGETGLLVPIKDAVALTRALETLIVEPARARQMGLAGRRRALDFYDERSVVARQIEIIGRLASSGQAFASQDPGREAEAID